MRLLYVSNVSPLRPLSGFTYRAFSLLKWLSQRFAVDLVFDGVRADLESSDLPLSTLCSATPVPCRPGLLDYCSAVLGPRPYHNRLACGRQMEESLRRQLTAVRYDLVWVNKTLHLDIIHDLAPALPAIMDQHASERAVWDSLINHDPRCWAKPFFRWNRLKTFRANERYYRWLSGVVAISPDDLSYTRSHFPWVRSICIPMGFDPDTYRPHTPRLDRRTLLFCGTGAVRNQEAVRNFCEFVLPRLRRLVPEVRLLWIGDVQREQLRFALPPEVELTGRVASIAEHLANGDVFIAPFTMGEGVKAKMIEALAVGKVVVSTSTGMIGLHESDNDFIKIRDDWDSFADAAAGLLQEPKLAELCAAARRHAEARYQWERVLEPLANFVKHVVQGYAVART